jgi:hypothetical protein
MEEALWSSRDRRCSVSCRRPGSTAVAAWAVSLCDLLVTGVASVAPGVVATAESDPVGIQNSAARSDQRWHVGPGLRSAFRWPAGSTPGG